MASKASDVAGDGLEVGAGDFGDGQVGIVLQVGGGNAQVFPQVAGRLVDQGKQVGGFIGAPGDDLAGFAFVQFGVQPPPVTLPGSIEPVRN